MLPYLTTAGDNVTELRSIVAAGQASGVKHFLAEQHLIAHPDVALRRSIDYLTQM